VAHVQEKPAARLRRRLPLPASPFGARDPGSRDRLSRLGRALGGRWLTLVTGACAALPLIVSTVHAVQYHWQPTDDKAIIATRAWDVLTGHTPLLGQFSTVSEITGHATYTLGPMQYWLIALPARLGAPLSMAITEGVVNILAVLGAVALARRRGGRVLMFAAAAAIALMCMSLASESFRDTWNSAAPLFPFLLLLFLCWSLACGDHRLLPLTVLVASFVVQCHLSYLAPIVGLMAIGLVGLAVSLIGRRRDRERAVRGGSLARWGVATLLVAAVCWTPTVIDQVSRRPGNLTQVVNYATAGEPTLGANIGWHAVVRTLGLPPWWLYVPGSRWDRYQDVLAKPGALRVASTLVLLALLALVAVVAALRRRGDLLAAALIGLALCAAVGVVAAQTPATPKNLASTVGYTLWWASHVGMWVYLVLAWAAWLALSAVLRPLLVRAALRAGPGLRARLVRLRQRRSVGRAVVAVAGPLLGIAAVAVAGAAVSATAKRDQHYELYAPIAKIDAALDRAIPSSMTVRFEGGLDPATLPIKPAIRYELVRRNVRVLAQGSYFRLGYWYELFKRPYNMTLYVSNGPRRPARDASRLIRVGFSDPAGRHNVYVWLSRAGGNLGARAGGVGARGVGARSVSARGSRGRSGRTRRPRRP
jgi:hypothetical protein